jgi:putative flippase GtrA
VLCGALAQAGLVLAYAGFGWETSAAVLFSLAVSVGPSYWGSRAYVWSGLSRHRRRAEATGFIAVAVVGSVTAMALTHLTHQVGQLFSADRAVLAVWVSAGSVLATVVVWLTRYVVLDRFLFAPRR